MGARYKGDGIPDISRDVAASDSDERMGANSVLPATFRPQGLGTGYLNSAMGQVVTL